MRQKSVQSESPSERIVQNIRRATRKRHSSEEKIRIVLDGLRGDQRYIAAELNCVSKSLLAMECRPYALIRRKPI